MTNKDTERLVQQKMQQTIPDKDALWAKIESGLPQQPEFGQIRRSSGRIRTVYRAVGAAACFLLIVGGLGIWQAGHSAKTDNAAFLTETPRKQAVQEAADEAPAAAEADAANDEDESLQYAAGDSNTRKNTSIRQELNDAVASEYGADNADAAFEAENAGQSVNASPAAEITLSGTIFGDAAAVQADAALLTETQEVLDAGEMYMVKEEPLTEEARENGVLLGYELNGQEILLAAYQGRYQMIADGRAYYVPETGRALLDDLTEGH